MTVSRYPTLDRGLDEPLADWIARLGEMRSEAAKPLLAAVLAFERPLRPGAPLARRPAPTGPRVGKPPASALGERIRARRMARGWTQARLADAAGIHEHTVQNCEAKGRTPSVEHLAAIARALGTTMDCLWRNEEP